MPTIKQTVAIELRKKIRLERIFTPEVKSVFNLSAKNFKTSVAATGMAPVADSAPWKAALLKHYNRTQDAFRTATLQQQKAFLTSIYFKQNELTGEQDAQFDLALLAWANISAENASAAITQTSQDNMESSLVKARELISEQELPTDNLTLAATATAILKRKYRGRVSGITVTETQSPAESTKFAQAEVLSGITPSIVGGGFVERTESTKGWFTVGDIKVRNKHKAVNGQRQNVGDNFIVSGSQLAFPGDRSQGAPIELWAGCRCSAVYRVA